jgi:hypothetical protein
MRGETRINNQYGISAWALEAESSVNRCARVDIPPAAASQENWCKGVNIVPGAPTDQSAYRSEVAGLFVIATMVREICSFYDITAGTAYLGCDGISALLNCIDLDYVVKSSASYFDLITATRAMLQQCPVQWIPHHVLGHQDDNTAGLLSITRWMKKLKYIGPTQFPRYRQFTISGEPWAIWLKNEEICRNLHSTLHTATGTCGKERIDSWERHGKFGKGS